MNQTLRTISFLTSFALFLGGMGLFLGGLQGMAVALIVYALGNFGLYAFSDKLILSSCRAQPVPETDAPEIYDILKRLSHQSGLPCPRLYLLPSASPNVFACGRDPRHAVIGVTKGLVDLLNREELSGVLAHELAHLERGETRYACMAAVLAGAVTMTVSMLRWTFMLGDPRRDHRGGNLLVLFVSAFVIPFAALLIQLAVSKSREYEADQYAAEAAGNPLYLASALQKIDAGSRRLTMHEARMESAHLFIVNPLRGHGWERIFGTHPPLQERVLRLEKMAGAFTIH